VGTASQESPTPHSYGGLHRRVAFRTHWAHTAQDQSVEQPCQPSHAPIAAPRRGLLAVLAADVAGYSRLMERAEEFTHQRMTHIHHRIVLPTLARHDGRLIKHMGDGFLATFHSAVVAARCALEIHAQVAAVNANAPAGAFLFRMGLNLADIIIEPQDVFDDGVNVAARLQKYADPGGLIVSGIVAEAIRRSVAHPYRID
jgi:adenylate cyclase